MSKSSKNSLAITIVNYNGGQVIIDCLKSIDQVKDEAKIEIWLVDNASSDGSVAEIQKLFPKLNYILNDQNLGFGKAHNQALRQITTDYALILNPDTLLTPGIISGMIDYLNDHPDVGAATSQIVFENGQVDLTAHRGFPTPEASLRYFLGDSKAYHLTDRVSDQPHPVDAISGAFFFARTEVLKQVNYFDEDYFMYGEDLDLSFQIKKAGYQIMYLPQFKIIHYKGVSSGIKKETAHKTTATSPAKLRAFNAFYEAMWIFYRKNYYQQYPIVVSGLVWLGIHLKWWLAKRKMTV